MTQPYTIGGINLLPEEQKRKIYYDLIPDELLNHFGISRSFVDAEGHSLVRAEWAPGNPSVEIALFHQADFPDPILYGHLTDTLNGQVRCFIS
jgi:hypothetical protein